MFTALVAGALLLVLAGGASAITYGVPDGIGHPEVGALLAQHAFSDGTWEECTGTLIAPRVFLTAEHCDEGVSRVEVTFASAFDRATSTTYWGTWHGDSAYGQSQSDPHDVAVVVLDKAVRSAPAAGRLAEHSLRQPAVHVGRLRSAGCHERSRRQNLPLLGRPLRHRR